MIDGAGRGGIHRPRRVWGLLGAGAVLLVLALLTGRMLWGARQELVRARQAAAIADRAAQVRHLRRALAYYAPANPWVDQARQELWRLAQKAEQGGDPLLALDALHQLRFALLRIKHVTQPFAESLAQVNAAIARLESSGTKVPKATSTKRPQDQRRLRRLRDSAEVNPGWAALGLIGFLLWAGGALGVFFLGLSPKAAVVTRKFWPWAAVVAVGLGLFGLGMGLA